MNMFRRGQGLLALAMVSVVGWALWRPAWPNLVRDWIGQQIPWLARLLDTWEALFALAFWWMVLREPRWGPGVLILWALYAVPTLLELDLSWFLGGSLALLSAVALVARPWPNRTIMARCAGLAALAVGADAIAG